MERLTEQVVEFAATMSYDRLPHEVVHEAKMLVLDSVGCALAGISTDKGKLAVELAAQLGGEPQSTIVGVPPKPPARTRPSPMAS